MTTSSVSDAMRFADSTPENISYRWGARTRAGRALIAAIENMTGRPGLLRMAAGYQRDITPDHDFWAVMFQRYQLRLEVSAGELQHIPTTGPLVCVANHPYGILDGLSFGRLMSMRRGADFKILANAVFCKAPEIASHILPVDFAGTREAQAINLNTRKQALAYLAQGGAIAIFPGGAVSTAARPFGPALDPYWKTFTAKLISHTGAQVVPLFFDGSNNRLFQIASHLSLTLRLALLIDQFNRRVGTSVSVRIRAPLSAAEMAPYRGDPKAMMDFLRRETYALSGRPVEQTGYGKIWD